MIRQLSRLQYSATGHGGERGKSARRVIWAEFSAVACCPNQSFLDDRYARLTRRVGRRGALRHEKPAGSTADDDARIRHAAEPRSRYFRTQFGCRCTCTHAGNAFRYYSRDTTVSARVRFTMTAGVPTPANVQAVRARTGRRVRPC